MSQFAWGCDTHVRVVGIVHLCKLLVQHMCIHRFCSLHSTMMVRALALALALAKQTLLHLPMHDTGDIACLLSMLHLHSRIAGLNASQVKD